MNIMLGGHLDCAFVSGSYPGKFARCGSERPSVHKTEDDPYRALFHRAGMIALLSDAVIRFPDLSLGTRTMRSFRAADGRTYDPISLQDLEQDAQRLARLLVYLGVFSDEALATMHLRARDDFQEAKPAHHVEDVLVAALHAWMTRSTLVLSRGDQQILQEIVASVIEHGLALPFGLPDLHPVSWSDPSTFGAIANLKPDDVADLNDLRDEPVIRTYRQRLRLMLNNPRANCATVLAAALQEARAADRRLREAPADILLTTCRARIFDSSNIGCVELDPFNWRDRRGSTRKMHVIIMSGESDLSRI